MTLCRTLLRTLLPQDVSVTLAALRPKVYQYASFGRSFLCEKGSSGACVHLQCACLTWEHAILAVIAAACAKTIGAAAIAKRRRFQVAKVISPECPLSACTHSAFECKEYELRPVLHYRSVPKFWAHQKIFHVFCDHSVREKDWRSRARGAKAT